MTTPRPTSRRLELPRIDGRPGPAERLSLERAVEIIDDALAAAYDRRAPRPRWRWSYAAVAAIAIALLAASAAALWGRGPSTTVGVAPVAPMPSFEPRRPAAEPEVSPDAPPRETARRAAPARTRREVSAPSDLLDEANRLRRRGEWRAAERLYARVRSAGADSWPGYIATAAAAGIRLEHLDDPDGALRLYREALAGRPGDALEPELLWGVAACQRRLASSDGERAALRPLLARQPGSPYQARAERRLVELDAGATGPR